MRRRLLQCGVFHFAPLSNSRTVERYKVPVPHDFLSILVAEMKIANAWHHFTAIQDMREYSKGHAIGTVGFSHWIEIGAHLLGKCQLL